MKCPGPAFCPFSSETRFKQVLALIAFLLVLMCTIAMAAIIKGKDGIITGAVCTTMTAIVTTLLVGGLHRHRRSLKESATGTEGGDTHAD
jgi:Na+/melibiose symporter-like transporter